MACRKFASLLPLQIFGKTARKSVLRGTTVLKCQEGGVTEDLGESISH